MRSTHPPAFCPVLHWAVSHCPRPTPHGPPATRTLPCVALGCRVAHCPPASTPNATMAHRLRRQPSLFSSLPPPSPHTGVTSPGEEYAGTALADARSEKAPSRTVRSLLRLCACAPVRVPSSHPLTLVPVPLSPAAPYAVCRAQRTGTIHWRPPRTLHHAVAGQATCVAGNARRLSRSPLCPPHQAPLFPRSGTRLQQAGPPAAAAEAALCLARL